MREKILFFQRINEKIFRQEASSDEYLLDMTDSQADEILISLGWEKLLRKDHLMLFRKYDHDLEVYSYKSKSISNNLNSLGFMI